MTRRTKILLVCGVLLVTLVGLGYGIVKRREKAAEEARVTYKVTRKAIAHTLQLAGKITPVFSMVITPRQSGRIVEIGVVEGAQVKAGDLLFTMRLEAQGQTELLQARAEVRRIELDVQTQAARLDDKRPVRELIGAASVVKDENELERARLELKAARERLTVFETDLGLGAKAGKSSNTTSVVNVSSPRPGIVTLIDKRPGDFVWGGGGGDSAASERMVMMVADMSSLMVRTRVLEADIRYVKLELPVNVRLDAYPDVKYTGRVKHVGGQGRTDTKVGYTYFDVDVSVDQHDARVLPEMNATIELIFEQRENVLTLPIAAVAIFPDKALVSVRDPKNKSGNTEKEVTVGVVNESEAEILTGLTEGEEVLEIDFAALELGDKDEDEGTKGSGGKGAGSKGGKRRGPG